jgi:hypothetical protein
MRKLFAVTAFLLLCSPLARGAALQAPSTTNNDDSCDIGPLPAATLLLPYFAVETANRDVDTFFTVVNVSHLPQIAHITIWTDWAFPVLSFNVFLTGYDVQPISLYDVIVNAVIAPRSGGGGTSSTIKPGALSAANGANPNLSIAGCENLPGTFNPALRAAIQAALVTGIYNAPGFTPGCSTISVGSPASSHPTATTAIGYVTIDVTSRCSARSGADPAYFTSEILFDNVLTGDYETFSKRTNSAGGNPLVHIRAVPEGGPAGSLPSADTSTSLPYTFYGRYINGQSVAHIDRRQPLGSTFAARWIQGGPGLFNTALKIWREGVAGATSCGSVSPNGTLPIAEFVRFDEHENSSVFAPCTGVCIPEANLPVFLPPTSARFSTDLAFPPTLTTPGDNNGWFYLNLDSGIAEQTVNRASHPNFPQKRASQNWVIVSMNGTGSTAGQFSVDFDATSLGNGCSPPAALSTAHQGAVPIGPAGGALICPPGLSLVLGLPCLAGIPPYNGTNVNP